MTARHRLTKHHGLGNDFLVLLGTGAELAAITPDHAVRWCHRHTGVGADGLLLGVTDHPDADLRMTLYNADGSRAEMSGNGIRCLAQAEVDRRAAAGHGTPTTVGQQTPTTAGPQAPAADVRPTDGVELRIVTDGGPRTVTVRPGPDAATVVAAVDMGPALPGPTADRPPAADVADPVALVAEPARSVTIDMGNPHLVLLVDDPAKADAHRFGPHWEAGYDAGINVHAIAPTPGAADELDMEIWERGAGATLACGTGATAAVHAAHTWGLVGTRATVHMPGGDVEVEVGERMTLHGPSVRIATVEVEA